MNYPPQPPFARQYGTSTPPIPGNPQQYPTPIPRAASAAPHLGPSTPSGLKPPAPHQGMPQRQPSPAPFPPGSQPSPGFMQRSPSPAGPPPMHRAARRHYPTASLQNQQQQPAQFFTPGQDMSNGFSQPVQPVQSPTPSVPFNPNQSPYLATTGMMANLSINGSSSHSDAAANAPINIPLIGQPPQIHDLLAHPPPIVLPPNVSFPYWMISILYPSF